MRDNFFYEQNGSIEPPKQYTQSSTNYLPSKKFVLTALGIVIIGTGFLFKDSIMSIFKKIGNIQLVQPKDIPVSVASPAVNQITIDFTKDTDGDGIPDWQESLMGTDSEVYTTLDEIPVEMRELVNDSSSFLNVTDKLALSIYERARANPTGGSYEQNLQAATSKEILDLAESIDQQLTTYILEDLNILMDVPLETTLNPYQNTINSFVKKTNTVQLMASGQSKILQNQKNNVEETLRSYVIELLKTPVPFEYAEHHLVLVNALAHAHDVFAKSLFINPDDEEILRMTLLLVFQKNINLVDKKLIDLSIVLNLS